MEAAASRAPPSASSPSGPASSTPTRSATPATRPRPRSSSPSMWTLDPRRSPSPRPRPTRASVGGTYTVTASGRGKRQPSHLLDRPVGEWKLQHLGCDRHLRRRRVPASSTPTRPATPTMQPHPRPSSPSIRTPSRRPSPSPRPRPTQRSWGAPTRSRRAAAASATRSPSRSTPRRMEAAASRVPTVTFVAVGTCVIDANQAGNASYEAATQLQQSFVCARNPDHHLHLDPAQPSGRGRHLHGHGERRGARATRSPSRSTPRRREAAASRVPPSPSSPPGPASSTPTRPATPATRPPPSSSSPSRCSEPRPSPSPRPRPTLRSWGARYTVTAQRWRERQPGHLLDRPLGEWKLQHLGCHRHLRRHRDLRHRRQPGRQRQLRGRHPAPAVLRGARNPDHHLHLDPAQPCARRSHLHAHGERWGKRQPGHLLDRPVGEWKLLHLGRHRHFRRRRDVCHRRQPGRQRQLRGRHPGPAVFRRRRLRRTSTGAAVVVQPVGERRVQLPRGHHQLRRYEQPEQPTGGWAHHQPERRCPISGETETLQANSAQNFVVTSNTPTNPSGSVTAYPNVGTYAYTGVLDDYTSLTSTYNLTMPIGGGRAEPPVAWAMQDDWLVPPGNSTGRSPTRWRSSTIRATDNALQLGPQVTGGVVATNVRSTARLGTSAMSGCS